LAQLRALVVGNLVGGSEDETPKDNVWL